MSNASCSKLAQRTIVCREDNCVSLEEEDADPPSKLYWWRNTCREKEIFSVKVLSVSVFSYSYMDYIWWQF